MCCETIYRILLRGRRPGRRVLEERLWIRVAYVFAICLDRVRGDSRYVYCGRLGKLLLSSSNARFARSLVPVVDSRPTAFPSFVYHFLVNIMNRHSHTPSTISRASSSTTNKLWGSGTL